MTEQEELLEKFVKFQDNGYIHPLTCRVNSRHKLLKPFIQDDNILLQCEDCGFLQKPNETVIKFVSNMCDHNPFKQIEHLFSKKLGDKSE